MTISTIVLAITGAFGSGGTGGPPSKNEGVFKKWLDRLADALKRLAGKAVETLPSIVGSVVGAILSFLGKAVGFVAEHTLAVIVFASGLIGVWLMQRLKRIRSLLVLVLSSPLFFLSDVFNTLLRYLVSHNATYDNS